MKSAIAAVNGASTVGARKEAAFVLLAFVLVLVVLAPASLDDAVGEPLPLLPPDAVAPGASVEVVEV